MIISEELLRRRIRSLLLEAQVYPLKKTLEDIEFYRKPFEAGEFEQIEQRLRSKWDRGYSKYSQVIKKDIINGDEPIDHILDAIDNFIPYYSRVGPKMQAEIGRGDLTSSDLRVYVEGQASDKLNKSRTTKRVACRRQVPIREGEECQDFKVIHADRNWVVVHPKTMLGSMSWAVGLADGSEERYKISSNGSQIGRVGWCTAAYSVNRFPMYAGNMHMYYFVKNSGYDISDRFRRLCVSWKKDEDTGKVQISYDGHSTVDANNQDLPKEKLSSLISQEIVEKMKADASSRKATSLTEMAGKVTLPIVKQDIENLRDDPEVLETQLRTYAKHAKDIEVINFFLNYEDHSIRYNVLNNDNLPEDIIRRLLLGKDKATKEIIARREVLPEDIIRQFAQDESQEIKTYITYNKNLPEDLARQLAQDESEDVRKALSVNTGISEDLVRQLAQDESQKVRSNIARREKLPEDLARQLAQDKSEDVRSSLAARTNLSEDLIIQLAKDESFNVRGNIAFRRDLPEDVVRQLAQDESSLPRYKIASGPDLPEDLVRQLVQDEDKWVRTSVAGRKDLPEDLVRQLAQDESFYVRNAIARRRDLPKNLIRQLAQDESSYVRTAIARRRDLPKNLIRQLAQDESSYVRTAIARRRDLPEDVVEQLEQDEDEGVRKTLSRRILFPESKLLRNYINMLLS